MGYLPPSAVLGFFDDVLGQTVKVVGGPDVEAGNNPGHEELRQREQIREVHHTKYLGGHELGRVADQHRQGKVVGNEENKRRDDEDLLRRHQILELPALGNLVPFSLGRLVGWSAIGHRDSPCSPLRKGAVDAPRLRR